MKIHRFIPSEATIQAELYSAIKAAGFVPHLEQVLILKTFTRTGRRGKIRVDVLIARGEEVLAAIEVKSSSRVKRSEEFTETRQHGKYQQLGIPFRFCTNLTEIPACVAWLKSL